MNLKKRWAVDEDAIADAEVEDETMFAAEPDEDDGGGQPIPGAASSARYPQLDEQRLARALQAEERHRVATRKAQVLDDVPASVKRRVGPMVQSQFAAVADTVPQEQFFVKKAKSPEALEKALEKEIPWNLIDHAEKELYVEAERKQWQEHIDFGAVRPFLWRRVWRWRKRSAQTGS